MNRRISSIFLCLLMITSVLVVVVPVGVKASGVPFTIEVTGNVNGVDFTVNGIGIVDPIGVYSGSLTFSNMPPNFHPVVMTAFTASICCYYLAEERNGALNMVSLGVTSYYTERILTFLPDMKTLTIIGNVTQVNENTSFIGTIVGNISVPDDLIGDSRYKLELNPAGSGIIIGNGKGYLLRANGEEVQIEITETNYFDPTKSLPFKQFRHVTESGSLDELTYGFVLHSVVDRLEEATIDINPNTLNLKSKGKWISCYIELPEDHYVSDINIDSVTLEEVIPAQWGKAQKTKLMVKFDRSDVEDMLSPGTYNLKVNGQLEDGTVFEGYSDEIRVIDPP